MVGEGSAEGVPLIDNSETKQCYGKPADYMLVFPIDQEGKPADGADKEVEGKDIISSIFVAQKETPKIFTNFYEACGSGNPKKVKLGELRKACMKDFSVWLPRMGFDVKTFKSVDEDELLMYISLDNPAAQKFYADKANMHLQVSEDTVKKMGITYPAECSPDETSPPWITYDSTFDDDQISKNPAFQGMKSVYKSIYKIKDPDNGSFIRQIDAIRVIRRSIQRLVDLDDMVGSGILAAKYPIHVLQPLDELRAEWACFFPSKMLNPFSAQPINRLRNYFGESVAFYFAFISLTVRRLTILAGMGLCYKVAAFFIPPSKALFADLAWALVVAAWSGGYLSSWKRQEFALCVEWDMLDISNRAALRADFRGEMKPSPLNASEETKQYSPWHKFGYQVFSAIVTVIFLACATIGIMAPRALDGMEFMIVTFAESRKTVVSIAVAVVIQIFTLIWGYLAKALVNLENPRTDAEYAEGLINKMAPLNLFTAYNTFIYVAVGQAYGARKWGWSPCPSPADDPDLKAVGGDCVAYLQTSILTTFASMGAIMIVGMMMPFITLKRSVEAENKAYIENKKKTSGDDSVIELPSRTFMEQQAKMNVWDTDAEIADYMTTVTALGYVLIFGATAPLCSVVALFVLMFQLRANAYKLTRLLRRPYPSMAKGIGAWKQMIEGLAWIGLIFYVAIPIINSKLLLVGEGEDHEGKWEEHMIFMLFFATEHAVIFIKILVDAAIPNTRPESELLLKRRTYVQEMLLLGQDDPDKLPDECKKPPVKVEDAKLTDTSATFNDYDHKELNLALCGPKGFIVPEAELPKDRDQYV
jgi:anoctamin-10